MPVRERQEVQVLPRAVGPSPCGIFPRTCGPFGGGSTRPAQYLDIETSRKRLADLEPELSRPDLWDDPEIAQRVTREYAS